MNISSEDIGIICFWKIPMNLLCMWSAFLPWWHKVVSWNTAQYVNDIFFIFVCFFCVIIVMHWKKSVSRIKTAFQNLISFTCGIREMCHDSNTEDTKRPRCLHVRWKLFNADFFSTLILNIFDENSFYIRTNQLYNQLISCNYTHLFN